MMAKRNANVKRKIIEFLLVNGPSNTTEIQYHMNQYWGGMSVYRLVNLMMKDNRFVIVGSTIIPHAVISSVHAVKVWDINREKLGERNVMDRKIQANRFGRSNGT